MPRKKFGEESLEYLFIHSFNYELFLLIHLFMKGTVDPLVRDEKEDNEKKSWPRYPVAAVLSTCLIFGLFLPTEDYRECIHVFPCFVILCMFKLDGWVSHDKELGK